MLVIPVISYWSTREIARGQESGMTAILSAGILSVGGAVAYIIIALLMGSHADANHSVLIFAAVLIPFMFLNSVLTAINLGSKPQSTSYGTILLGAVQAIAGLFLINFFNMRIDGAIITLMISYTGSNLILFFYAKDKIKKGFKKELLRKWIRHFWVPLYPSFSIIVARFDIAIFTLLTGSVNGLAFWTAAMALPSTISNSGLVSRAVYSKLLEDKGSREYVRENIVHLLYFAIPITAMGIVFAKPTLFALNQNYETASTVSILLSIYMFFNVLSNVFISFLTGLEKVDTNENSTFRDYIKSKLFFLPTVRLIQCCIYVVSLGIGLSLLIHWATMLDMLTYWSLAVLIAEIPVTIYLYRSFKQHFLISIDLNSTLKYLMVSVFVFGITYIITTHFLHYKNNIFEFLPNLLLFMAFGFVSYLCITYVVDSKTRILFKSIMNEIRSRF